MRGLLPIFVSFLIGSVFGQNLCEKNETFNECGPACEKKCGEKSPDVCADVCVSGK
jgi:hypothetical protein